MLDFPLVINLWTGIENFRSSHKVATVSLTSVLDVQSRSMSCGACWTAEVTDQEHRFSRQERPRLLNPI